MAINKVETFRLRILDDKVVLFDEINAGSTLAREDGTFGFSFMKFSKDFKVFNKEMQRKKEAIKNSTGLRLKGEALRQDVIHYSSFPCGKFTALTHPRNFNIRDSIPKILFGKAFLKDEKCLLPISVEAHHSLVDGLHVAKFLEYFQALMNE